MLFVTETEQIWCFTEKKIITINNKTGRVIHCFGTKKVTCAIEYTGTIWAGTDDRLIEIFDLHGDFLVELHGHTGPVFSLAHIGKFIWSTSWDKRVILWNADVSSIFV